MAETKETKTTRATKTKAPKQPRAKKEKTLKKDLVVFAFRLTEAERKVIHEAAGPGGASTFVKAVSLAAACEDDAAYRQAIKEAREARA